MSDEGSGRDGIRGRDGRGAGAALDVEAARATCTVRVVLPTHLRALAGISREVTLEVPVGVREEARVAAAGAAAGGTSVTQRQVLDALEAAYPALVGTVRDRSTGRRRPFIRFFACEEDVSHEPPDAPLPAPVACGAEPFVVLGAIAGGYA